MRLALTLAAGALVLAGCGRGPDPRVCVSAPGASQMEGARNTLDNPRNSLDFRRAASEIMSEACLVERARRLASAPEPAAVVGAAALVACRERIEETVMLTGQWAEGNGFNVGDRMAEQDDRLKAFAVAAVVEARAGGCAVE